MAGQGRGEFYFVKLSELGLSIYNNSMMAALVMLLFSQAGALNSPASNNRQGLNYRDGGHSDGIPWLHDSVIKLPAYGSWQVVVFSFDGGSGICGSRESTWGCRNMPSGRRPVAAAQSSALKSVCAQISGALGFRALTWEPFYP